MQSISSFLWILLSNDLHRQNIRQIPDRENCVFGRWRSFMYIDFENLRFYKHLSKKNTTWDHFLVTNKNTRCAIFRCSINDGWFEADATIWLKSIDVSDL